MTSTILVVFTRIQALELETRADQPRYYESPGLIVDIPLLYLGELLQLESQNQIKYGY